VMFNMLQNSSPKVSRLNILSKVAVAEPEDYYRQNLECCR